ncbi:MAG TPA: RimK family alpha-L-glutamate ligase [Firmicutes bacterium]|nr:RimK family alpha-L-glutamate ligase [Bacillota bacterium]
MKKYIMILTARPDSHASMRFREAARERKIGLKAVDPKKALLEIGTDGVSIRSAGRLFPAPVAVIPRLGPGNYENGIAMLDHLEASGVAVANNGDAIFTAHDTFKSLLKLKKAGLNVPHTARILSIKDLRIARKLIPGPPWILKTFTGAMGIGTMLMHKVDELEAICATLWALGQPILMQEYLHSKDETIEDIRSLVIGNRVVGAIRRKATAGEFRANVHKGGVAEAVELSKVDMKLAMKAAKSIGLNIAGVDWIVTRDGPLVLEVNATPGFQGFESATGMDIAGEMIDFALHYQEQSFLIT